MGEPVWLFVALASGCCLGMLSNWLLSSNARQGNKARKAAEHVLEATTQMDAAQRQLVTRVEALERAHDQLHGDYRRLNQKVNKKFFDDRDKSGPGGAQEVSDDGIPAQHRHLFER